MNVTVNRHGVDQTTLEITQVGKNESQVSLRDVLLDENKSYHLAVSSLNIPFDAFPLYTPDNSEIFRIIRRRAGADPAVQNNTSLIVPYTAVFRNNHTCFDASAVVGYINNMLTGFNQAQGAVGIPILNQYGKLNNVENLVYQVVPPDDDARFIWATITADARIAINMTTTFTNHFALQFTRYGIELLGLQGHGQSVIVNGEERFVIAVTTVNQNGVLTSSTGNPWTNQGVITEANNIREVRIVSKANIYQLFDHRIAVMVQSHLPIANNIRIVDGQERLDNAICRVFLHTPLAVHVQYSGGGAEPFAHSFHDIQRRLFNGQVQLVRKSQAELEWHRLLTSYQMKFIRLSLWIEQRKWNNETATWAIKRSRLNVPASRHWEATLRFVSDI